MANCSDICDLKSQMNKCNETGKPASNGKLLPEDYYLNEHGLMVFTEAYHRKRGHCCRNGCKHCPYGHKNTK